MLVCVPTRVEELIVEVLRAAVMLPEVAVQLKGSTDRNETAEEEEEQTRRRLRCVRRSRTKSRTHCATAVGGAARGRRGRVVAAAVDAARARADAHGGPAGGRGKRGGLREHVRAGAALAVAGPQPSA